MRWLTLYARSRQIPAAFTAIVVGMTAVLRLTGIWGGIAESPRLVALLLAGGVALAAAGLAGNEVALDRTAAIRWPPRRAVHVLVIAAAVGAALIILDPLAPNVFIMRGSLGSAGLAAIGAVAFGGQFAWILPIGWFAVTLVVPPASDTGTQLLTWITQPPGTLAATVTSLVLGIGGTLAYALCGPRG